MYFAELLYIMFSPSNENKSSVDQLPPNSIVSPLTQLILQIPGKEKKNTKTEKQKIPVLKPPRRENPEQKRHKLF